MGRVKKEQAKKRRKTKSEKKSVSAHTEKTTRLNYQEKSSLESIKWQKRMENPEFRETIRKSSILRRLRQKDEKISMENENDRLGKRVAFLEKKIDQLMEDMFLISEDMSKMDFNEYEEMGSEKEIRWIDVVEHYSKEFEETIIDWHRYVGLDKENFENLSNHYSDYYYSSTWEGLERSTIQHKPTLNHRTSLFITLLMFRQYPTGIILQSIFHVHERTLARIYVRVLSSLQRSFKNQLGWPSPKELSKLPIPDSDLADLDGVKFIVDGTIIRMYRSKLKFRKGESDPYYQPSKGKTGENTLVFIDLNGRIIWNSKLYPAGRFPDQKIWNHEKLNKYFIDTGAGLLGDLGFVFNVGKDNEKMYGVNPVNYEKRSKDPKAADYSREVSRHRVLIEHVFSQLKFFRIIGGLCRHFHPNAPTKEVYHDRIDMNVLMDVLCCIHNLDLKMRPMHDASRLPPKDSPLDKLQKMTI